MKLMIVGHKRFGKDHASEYLRDNFGLKYESSSRLCSRLFIYDALKDKYGYSSEEQCFQDRHNHRAEWFHLISKFNEQRGDMTALAAMIFSHCECYTGIRKKEELDCCREKWRDLLVVYIDRSKVLPLEDVSSCTISKSQADIIIENNEDLESFEDKLFRLGSVLFRIDILKQDFT